jgi:hypothetical protein
MLSAAALALAACQSPEPAVDGLKPQLRLLTEAQYRNIIRDVFGPHIGIGAPPDPILREDGLVASSAARATISPSGFERFATIGEGIARQVVEPRNRELLIPCVPSDRASRDDACASEALGRAGRLLYRRPLAESELRRVVELAGASAERLGDFYGGLQKGLTYLLVSPHFLFIQDSFTASAPERLTGFAKASRLSFFLWNTAPDPVLLDAAARGELEDDAGLRRQVKRLLESPRLADGVQAFFSDMLHLEKFATLAKDGEIYPAFDAEVTEDSRQQLLRTITWHLVDSGEDYRRLFDSRVTFMTEALGRIYRVPVPDTHGWSLVELPESERRAGIHTLAGFVASHSHPGRSSPTLRGRAVRELLLCQRVPDPPANVDFTAFATPDSTGLSARERLKAHNTEAACASCHKITDPIGFALENFDGAGQGRTREAGKPIDASGELDGSGFEDVAEFSTALSAHPGIPTCLVERLSAYAMAGTGYVSQKDWNAYLTETFERDGYRLMPLLEAIATSPNFFKVELPALQTASVRPEDVS